MVFVSLSVCFCLEVLFGCIESLPSSHLQQNTARGLTKTVTNSRELEKTTNSTSMLKNREGSLTRGHLDNIVNEHARTTNRNHRGQSAQQSNLGSVSARSQSGRTTHSTLEQNERGMAFEKEQVQNLAIRNLNDRNNRLIAKRDNDQSDLSSSPRGDNNKRTRNNNKRGARIEKVNAAERNDTGNSIDQTTDRRTNSGNNQSVRSSSAKRTAIDERNREIRNGRTEHVNNSQRREPNTRVNMRNDRRTNQADSMSFRSASTQSNTTEETNSKFRNCRTERVDNADRREPSGRLNMIKDRSANQADRQSLRSTSTQRTTTEETNRQLRFDKMGRVDNTDRRKPSTRIDRRNDRKN